MIGLVKMQEFVPVQVVRRMHECIFQNEFQYNEEEQDRMLLAAAYFRMEEHINNVVVYNLAIF